MSSSCLLLLRGKCIAFLLFFLWASFFVQSQALLFPQLVQQQKTPLDLKCEITRVFFCRSNPFFVLRPVKPIVLLVEKRISMNRREENPVPRNIPTFLLENAWLIVKWKLLWFGCWSRKSDNGLTWRARSGTSWFQKGWLVASFVSHHKINIWQGSVYCAKGFLIHQFLNARNTFRKAQRFGSQ